MKTKLSKQEILERVGTMAQLAGIRPYVLREGRKNGVSAADLWNGSGLSMTVRKRPRRTLVCPQRSL